MTIIAAIMAGVILEGGGDAEVIGVELKTGGGIGVTGAGGAPDGTFCSTTGAGAGAGVGKAATGTSL